MSILARIHEARIRRQATRDLKALSPELLRDIGIEPDGIDAAVTDAIASRGAKQRSSRASDGRPFAGPSFANGAWPYSWRAN